MDSEAKIWVDYSSKAYGGEPTHADLARFFASLESLIPADRLRQSQYGYISILSCSPTELASAKQLADHLRIPVSYKIEERIPRQELRQLRFAVLAVEGDFVDRDSDHNPLNRFPSLLCTVCRMPDERRLPEPFHVSAKQMLRRRQDGVPGVELRRNREVFWCSGGVFLASDRVKRILKLTEQGFSYAPVAATPTQELPFPCWAVRPSCTWGRRQNVVLGSLCPECREPLRRHVDTEVGAEALYSNRVVVHEVALPQADMVCAETWFGDRTRRPSESADFIRDVFVSGRLYDVLLRAKVRGLLLPEQFLAFSDAILMAESQSTDSWVKAKIKLLKEEGLA